MRGSKRPAVTAVRKLVSNSLHDVDAENDYGQVDHEREQILFRKELDLSASLGTIDLPPTTIKDFRITPFMKRLVCEGFTLTNS